MMRVSYLALLAMLLAIPSCVNNPATEPKTIEPAKSAPAVKTEDAPYLPKLVKMSDIEDRAQFFTNRLDESVIVLITSPSGLGNMVIARSGPRWPNQLTIAIAHDPAFHFSSVEKLSVVDTDNPTHVLVSYDKLTKLPLQLGVPETFNAKHLTITWSDGMLGQ